MGKLFVEERQIVIPGDQLATGMDYLPAGGAYRNGEDIRSSVLGVLTMNGRVLRVIPLKSQYRPRSGDMVICKIAEMTNNVWFAQLTESRDGVLTQREVPEYINDGDDLSHYYNYGDYVLAKIVTATRTSIALTLKGPGLRKLRGGRLVEVNPARVPRIIGKQGSMIGTIKDKTGCRMIVGQNGVVWLQGSPQQEGVAMAAIDLICEKGHLQGLTDIVGAFIDERMKDVTDVEEVSHNDAGKMHADEEQPTRTARPQRSEGRSQRGRRE